MQELQFNGVPEILDFVVSNKVVNIKTQDKNFYNLFEGSYLSEMKDDSSFKESRFWLKVSEDLYHSIQDLGSAIKYFNRYNINLKSSFYYEDNSTK